MAVCERASAASRRFSYRASRARRSARRAWPSASLPHVAAILSAEARSPAPRAMSIAIRSLHGASSAAIVMSFDESSWTLPASASAARSSEREERQPAGVGRQRLERARHAVGVHALVGDRRAHDGDVRGRGLQILGGLEGLVEATPEEGDARRQRPRGLVDRGELERPEGPLACERLVAERQCDGPEPHGGAGRVRDREALDDVPARLVDGVLVERAERRDGVRHEPCNPMGSSSVRLATSSTSGGVGMDSRFGSRPHASATSATGSARSGIDLRSAVARRIASCASPSTAVARACATWAMTSPGSSFAAVAYRSLARASPARSSVAPATI